RGRPPVSAALPLPAAAERRCAASGVEAMAGGAGLAEMAWVLLPMARQSLLPDQHVAFLVHGHPLPGNAFPLHVCAIVVIQTTLALKGRRGHATVSVAEVDDIIQHRIKVPHRPSTCASATSACGGQKVIAMVRHRLMATDSLVRACSH